MVEYIVAHLELWLAVSKCTSRDEWLKLVKEQEGQIKLLSVEASQ